jgi:hypothetical protein
VSREKKWALWRGVSPQRAQRQNQGKFTVASHDAAGKSATQTAKKLGISRTAPRAQARDAPGTLSQCSSRLRLPLAGSLPFKRPSEKPCIDQAGAPLTLPLAAGQSLKTAHLRGGKLANQGYSEVGLKPCPESWPHEKPPQGVASGASIFRKNS